MRFTKLVLNLRVTTYDLRQVTSPIMEIKRYYIVSYILYKINPTAQKLIRGPGAQALVSFKKYMPPPLPYFKVSIYPFPLPHFASIFFAYL